MCDCLQAQHPSEDRKGAKRLSGIYLLADRVMVLLAMETMRKIPNYVSSYIDESIDRALQKERSIFSSEMRLLMGEHHELIKMEFEYHKGVLLDEFDSRLKVIGEYVDTKVDREEVRKIIHEEKGVLN